MDLRYEILILNKKSSNTHSRVGLVQFSTKTTIEIGLDKYSTKKDLFRGLDEAKSRYRNMGYNSYAGLKLALDMLKPKRSSKTQKVIVLVTAGKLYLHPRRVKELRTLAMKTGTRIAALKLGKLTNRLELMEITRDQRLILNARYERQDFKIIQTL